MLAGRLRCRRVGGDNLADDQPVKEHPDRRQLLFHGGLGESLAELLDVGCHVQGLDIEDLREVRASHQLEKSRTARK